MATLPDSKDVARIGANSVFGYLRRTAEAVPDGLRWQTLSYQNAPGYAPGLWDGVAGIAIFLADYHRVTGAAQARDLAAAALRWCVVPGRRLEGEAAGLSESLGRGRSGIGSAMLRYAAATGDGPALATAVTLGDGATAAASVGGVRLAGGAPGPSFLWGTAGQGTFLVRLWEAARQERHLAAAVRCAEYLRDAQLPEVFGGAWPPPAASALPRFPSGFAPGLAGIGYFFAVLAGATGVRAWREATTHVAALLGRVARPDRGGLTWPLALDGAPVRLPHPEVPRCQWCLGAPGVGLFFVRAAAVLGDGAHRATAEAAGEATWAYGDVRGNPSYCHGLAGNAELFLELYGLTGDHRWLDRARGFAAQALAYRVTGPGDDVWPADEPGLEAPNFSTGAAGAGHVFLRLLTSGELPMALG